MRKFITTVGIALAFASMAASTANATSGPAMLRTSGTIGTGSNTGAISGNTATYPRHTFQVGGATVACNDATFRVTAVATTSSTIDPIFGACSLLVSNTPVGAATIDTPCDWSLAFPHATFNDATGAGSGGTVTTNCSTTVTVPAIGCTIHVAAQTRPGIASQNITATGAATSSATPWGSTISGNVAGLTYTATSGCPIAEHGTGQYLGEVAIRNVWGSL